MADETTPAAKGTNRAALVGRKVGETVAAVNHFFYGERQAVILTDGLDRPASRRA